MGGGIFISYRRDDTRQAAGRLADDLAGHFGAASIFRDVDGIDPGVEFAKALNKALGACAVMLVLIGTRWLDMRNADGRRRLDDPNDWIAQEIEVAVKRDIRVIPVLIDGARRPEASELPERLRGLVDRQSLDLDDGRWRGDLARLVETLARIPGLRLVGPASTTTVAPARKWNWKLIGYVSLGLFVAGGISNYMESGSITGTRHAVRDEPASDMRPADGPDARAPVSAGHGVDLIGPWVTGPDIDLRFYITQRGDTLLIQSNYRGSFIGGTAHWQGETLQADLKLPVRNHGIADVHCPLLLSPDSMSLLGTCSGAQTNFPFYISRA